MHRPIRGGIDVGLGLDIGVDEFYGPALERAHHLESRVADYPRIVVGNELWDYLNATETQKSKTKFGEAAAEIAHFNKIFITEDYDGNRILDFMGQYTAQQFPTSLRREISKKIDNYITKQALAAQLEKNDKFMSRYHKLRTYFDGRALFWS
jgi:hypothetical protein